MTKQTELNWLMPSLLSAVVALLPVLMVIAVDEQERTTRLAMPSNRDWGSRPQTSIDNRVEPVNFTGHATTQRFEPRSGSVLPVLSPIRRWR